MAKQISVRISHAEYNALYDAVDFIYSNIDGANDEQFKIHSRVCNRLNQICKKYKKQRSKSK